MTIILEYTDLLFHAQCDITKGSVFLVFPGIMLSFHYTKNYSGIATELLQVKTHNFISIAFGYQFCSRVYSMSV